MKAYKTPQELTGAINKELLNFLNTDFKEYVFETQREMVHKHVYSYKASDYAMYERRYDNGGLSDTSNMRAITYPKEGAILFVNETPPQEADFRNESLSLAEAVEVGDEAWRMHVNEKGKGPGPRPFTQETVNKMANSMKTYSTFKQYFNKLGIKTIRNK